MGLVKEVQLCREEKEGVIRAKVVFHSRDAAIRLVKASRDVRFKVKDKKVDTTPGKLQLTHSRV